MKERAKNNSGFTLMGVAVTAAAIGVVAVMGAIIVSYATRAKLRSEAKVAVIDAEASLTDVIAARMITALSPTPPKAAQCLTSGNFATSFNAANVNLPDATATVGLVAAASPLPNLSADAPTWFKAAATACSTNPQAPADESAAGLYLFCLRVGRTSPNNQKTSTNFLDSEIAFVQVRAELSSLALPHQQKVFGIPGPNNTTLPALSCGTWKTAPRAQQQLKLSYRIFWKRSGDDKGYNQYMGSKMVNVEELRGV